MVTVAAAWDPAACRSAALLEPTEWPYWRTVKVQLDLELTALPGEITTISPELRFLVRLPSRWPRLMAAARSLEPGLAVPPRAPRRRS